jgi:PAS domain S-box-containing protein
LKKKLLFLLVGDNIELIDEIDRALRQTEFKFHIENVRDVSSFRTSIKAHNYDMVLFDVNSNISYREIISESRAADIDVPFIAILDRGSYSDVCGILKEGFNNYCFRGDTNFLGFVIYKELTCIEKQKGLDSFEKEMVKEIERLAVTIESIGDGVITTDQFGSVIMINKAAIDMTGWSRNEAIGKPLNTIFNIFDKNTNSAAECPFNRVMRERRSLGLKENTVLISKDGKEMFVSASTAPIIDVEDTVIGVVVVFRDITRIKKSEDELRKLSMVVKHSPSLVLVADAKGHVEYVNPKLLEVSGYSFDEIKEKNFLEFIYTNNIDVIKEAEDSDWHGEVKLEKKNGEVTWQLAAISSIRDKEGMVTNWIGVSEDITERKKYEDKLANEQKKLQTIFDTAPVGMLIVDKNRYVRKANFSFGNILNKTMEEIDGKRIGEIINCKNFIVRGDCGISPECTGCRFRQGLCDIIDNKNEIQIREFSYPFDTEDEKEILWVSINAVSVIIDEEECALVVVEDITSKKKIEEALKWSRNFYITLFEEFPASIWQSGKDGEFVYFNKTWLKFSGRKMEEEINGRWIENMHPDDIENFTRVFNKALSEHKSFEIEFRLKRADGEYRWIVNEGRPFSNLEDNFAGFIGVCMDVTEQKQVTENLRKAKEAAEIASRSKSEFLANMSHEIRTPLNGILGMVNLTLQSDLTKDQRENLNIANSCADLLLSVINDILDYSKIEAGKMTIDEIEFDIYKLLDNTYKAHLFKVREKKLKYKYQIEDGIPRILVGDPNRLQQVLNNLISNAIKFTEFGEVKISLNIAERFGDKLLIKFSVSDTGIGIGDDEMQRLFKSFSQVDGSITRKYGGTGLGLAISKQLVEMMKGEIHVESEKNKGSIFSFTALLTVREINQQEEKYIDTFGKRKINQKLNTFVIEDVNELLGSNDENMEELLKGEVEDNYDKYMSKLGTEIENKNTSLIEKLAALIKEVAVQKKDEKVKSLSFKIQLLARRDNIESIKPYYDLLRKEITNNQRGE